MRRKKQPDPVDDYLKAEGFFYSEKARRERERNLGRPPVNTVRYERSERSRRLVYMDLVIILIMMGILIPFAQNYLQNRENYYGYKLDWDYNFGRDRVYHTLTIKAPAEEPDPSLDGKNIVEAVFTATGGADQTLTDLLPSPGGVRILTAEIPLEKLPDYVGCTVKLGDKEKSWKVYTGKVRYLPPLKRPGAEE